MLRVAVVLASTALLLTACSTPSPTGTASVRTDASSVSPTISQSSAPAATSAATSAPSSPRPLTTATSTACADADFKVGLSQAKPPGLNALFGVLQFTNSSSRTCTIHGWPKVTLSTPSNAVIGSASRGQAITDSSVTLKPGSSAYSYLRYTASRGDGGENIGCKETASFDYTFNVTPPIRGASAKAVPNPSLYLCIDDKQDLIAWAVMPRLETLDIG